METPSPDDLSGRILAGRYRVERPLRRGGMGAVYVARDLEADRQIALKVVRQSLIEDPQALARFKREARLTTELSHENIVACLDAGDDGGLLYIAMELLEGETLRERLDQQGRMMWRDTLPLVEQIVRALGVAHAHGVVHRDLKPENIMLTGPDKQHVKLLDFGVAKQARVDGESGNTSMTGTGFIVGTPGYVAPEVVLEGKTDDPRTDFYALGVVWFEMLTGQKPFTAKTAFALAMRHAHEPAPTPTSLIPYSPVPAPIERLVLQLMNKAPEGRPADCDALLAALVGLAVDAERSLAGTPTPGTFEPTLTDARFEAGRTDVMPWKGAGPPAAASVPTPTPTTVQGALLAGLAAVTPLPEGKDPRRRAMVALVLAVGIVLVGAVGGSVATWHLFLGRDSTAGNRRAPTRTEPPSPPPASGLLVGAERPASDTDKGRLVAVPPPPLLPSPASAPGAAVTTTPTPPRLRVETKTGRPSEEGDRAVEKATLKLKLDAWDLVIDGGPKIQGFRAGMQLDAGPHTLVFSSKAAPPVEKRLVLKPGETRTISGPDDVP